MASSKILEQKQGVVAEVMNKIKNSTSVVLFEYHKLTVAETTELRKTLRNTSSDFKIFKNTLVAKALKDMNIDLNQELTGPKAVAFGTDAIAPIKVLSEFAKKHPALVMKVGIVDGRVADIDMLNQLALIPSRDGLLTMLAAGMLEIPKNFAICLDLHSKNL